MRNSQRVKLMGALCTAALVWAVALPPDSIAAPRPQSVAAQSADSPVVLPGESPVADAAMAGDLVVVRSLLERGLDVNTAQGDGMTALHWAAENGDVELAELLIYAGANVGALTRVGNYTPLHLASKAGNASVVEVLLEAGSDSNARTTTGGATPLHFAAAAGDAIAIRLLLEYGADADATESAWGRTPLMFAAAYNRAEALRALLERGADPALTAKVVNVPARAEAAQVAEERRNERMELLLAFRARAREAQEAEGEQATARESEAKTEEEEEKGERGTAPKPDANARGAKAEQAAALEPKVKTEQAKRAQATAGRSKAAAEAEQEQATARDAGARTEEEEREQPARESEGNAAKEQETATSEDQRREQEEEEEGGRLSYADLVGNKGGLTPLLFAARQGNVEAVLTLLDGGADINQVSAGDHTSPLLMATINGHFDLALELLERGADPNLASDAGATPLYATINLEWAPRSFYPQPTAHKQQHTTYLEMMEALLEAGADPNARLTKHLWYMAYNIDQLGVNTRGATPFWRAAYGTDVEAMKLLVSYGADPSIPTEKPPERRRNDEEQKADPSGLPPVPVGGPGVYPIHAASGVGYGEGRAGNSHQHVPDGWLPAVEYLVEEIGADVNARDFNGYNAVHHAAARGDNELVLYLVEHGADVTAVSREGQTTVDMANGPVQRISPFPETIELLESLGAKNNHNCQSC